MNHQNINDVMMQAFEEAKKGMRIEEPERMMTRFAFEFVQNLIKPKISLAHIANL